jgi:hypothetical protein
MAFDVNDQTPCFSDCCRNDLALCTPNASTEIAARRRPLQSIQSLASRDRITFRHVASLALLVVASAMPD